jgi:hypothetical protein
LKPPNQLDQEQVAALGRLNEAGSVAFGGWTWQYELGEGCVLRMHRRFEGKVQSVSDQALRGLGVHVVPYATEGFGVKAAAASGGGSLDLFDSRLEGAAKEFAADLAKALGDCNLRLE